MRRVGEEGRCPPSLPRLYVRVYVFVSCLHVLVECVYVLVGRVRVEGEGCCVKAKGED